MGAANLFGMFSSSYLVRRIVYATRRIVYATMSIELPLFRPYSLTQFSGTVSLE